MIDKGTERSEKRNLVRFQELKRWSKWFEGALGFHGLEGLDFGITSLCSSQRHSFMSRCFCVWIDGCCPLCARFDVGKQVGKEQQQNLFKHIYHITYI